MGASVAKLAAKFLLLRASFATEKASELRQASQCRETQEFCKTAMSLGFLTEEQASRVVQAQSQGRQFLPLCGFSVPLLLRPQFLASPFNAYTRWKSLLYANDRLCGLGQQACGLRHRMGSLGHIQQPAQMVATP
jgi:hypothetical protein